MKSEAQRDEEEEEKSSLLKEGVLTTRPILENGRKKKREWSPRSRTFSFSNIFFSFLFFFAHFLTFVPFRVEMKRRKNKKKKQIQTK